MVVQGKGFERRLSTLACHCVCSLHVSTCQVLHSQSKALLKELEKEFDLGRSQLAHKIGEALPDGPLKAKHSGVWLDLLRWGLFVGSAALLRHLWR